VHFQTIFIFRPTHPRYFVSDLDPWAAKVTNERIWDTLGNMTQHYDARVIQFSKEPVVLHRTIFLGNSITEMDNWKTLTNDTTVVNRGISGDVTFGVLARLNDVVK